LYVVGIFSDKVELVGGVNFKYSSGEGRGGEGMGMGMGWE